MAGKLNVDYSFKDNGLGLWGVLSSNLVTNDMCAKTFSLANGQKFDLLVEHSSAVNVAVPL